jgi:hypothetical protein
MCLHPNDIRALDECEYVNMGVEMIIPPSLPPRCRPGKHF